MLLKANERFLTGSAVCLFVGANVLTGNAGGVTVPDHWVALTSAVRIGGAPSGALLARGSAVNGDQKLAGAEVAFDVFTWGETSYPVHKGRSRLTVKELLDYFYGYVAAK